MPEKQVSIKCSVLWSSIERFSSQAVQFLISLLIARILLPSDFGIVGMISIFIGISQSFIDSGFTTALVRKIDRSETDNSTVFYFNIVIGIVCYALLYVAAPWIAAFYKVPLLTPVTRVIALTLVFSSIQIVPRALLTAKADFKTQTVASLPATIGSALIGLWLAWKGYGVWVLIWQQLIAGIINTLLLWMLVKWKPRPVFSFQSLNELFSFGSKLMVSGLIDTLYNNFYTLIIGKIYSPSSLGFYTRAYSLGYFPSVNLAGVLQRGIFPILCRLQNDEQELIVVYRRCLRMSFYLIAPMMIGLCTLASPLIRVVLTAKWEPAALYLQILCFYFLWKPVVAINNNIYQVMGRSDLFLKLEVIKKVIGISFFMGCVPLGVAGMCAGCVVSEMIATLINMYLAGKVIPLTVSVQLRDIMPSMLLSVSMGGVMLLVGHFMDGDLSKLIAGISVGILFYGGMSYLLGMQEMRSLLLLAKRWI